MSSKRLLVTGGSGFIGANFIREAQKEGYEKILNLDVVPSKDQTNLALYRHCDLLDQPTLQRYFAQFEPTHIVHFAGRTDMFGTTVEDYAANHIGTEHLIAAIQGMSSVENAVFTSSQFVVGPGVQPKHDEDFRPHTIYGQSKVLSEIAVQKADIACSWTIIRPTNIWGRWHPRYPTEFWRVLKQGRYFHPGRQRVMRCYGYVGNLVSQTLKILAGENGRFHRKIFYVGDAPIDLFEWTNAFSKELTGHPVRILPRSALKVVARFGDIVIAGGGKFPLYSSRFSSMTEEYLTPMDATFAALGAPGISLEEGVRETVEWLRSEDEFWQ